MLVMGESYYIEYTKIDNQVKVTAIDPETGKEGTVICPANTRKNDMAELAVKKLLYVLKKTKHEP